MPNANNNKSKAGPMAGNTFNDSTRENTIKNSRTIKNPMKNLDFTRPGKPGRTVPVSPPTQQRTGKPGKSAQPGRPAQQTPVSSPAQQRPPIQQVQQRPAQTPQGPPQGQQRR